MSEDLITALILQLVGIGLLVAEIFVPSFGVLTVLALLCLGGGIYQAFHHGDTAGYVLILTTIILLPLVAIGAIRVWPKTFFGRRIAPPNVPSPGASQDQHPLRRHLGQTGAALTPLRPVGTCEFGEQRVECRAESGMIARDAKVVAVGIDGQSLIVRPVEAA